MKINVNKEYDTLKLMQFLQSNNIPIYSVVYDENILCIDGKDLDENNINQLISIYDNTPPPKSELEIAQDNINSLGSQLFEVQTQLMQSEKDKATLGQQVFSLQTQLMTKGVL